MLADGNIYFDFLRRWAWLIIFGILIALGTTWYALSLQPPLYQATATIQVGRAIQDRNPDQNQLAITNELIPVYAELARRDNLLASVADTLGAPLTAASIQKRLVVSPVPRTPLIDIRVIDTDPQRAAAIANEIARQVVLQSPNTSAQDSAQQAFVKSQVDDLQGKITNGQKALEDLDAQIAKMTSATDIQEGRQRQAALQLQVDNWQQSYARLVLLLEPSRTNLVTIATEARVPSIALVRSPLLYYALAAAIGGGMATLLGLLLQFLTNAVRSPDDLRLTVAGLQVLTIPRYRLARRPAPITMTKPTSTESAAYRQVRNALQSDGRQQGVTTLAVTSSQVGEGKTTTVANLAIAFANAGRQVVLVDANMRNPEIDQRFGISPAPGFSDLLLGDFELAAVLQRTQHANLRVVAAGSIPPDYVDLLSRETIDKVIAELGKAGDLILFDTPALLEEQETLLLARRVSGVLMVAEAGRVGQESVANSLALLAQTEVPVLAVVLNKVRSPRFNLARLPWSRESRNRSRAKKRRTGRTPKPQAPALGD